MTPSLDDKHQLRLLIILLLLFGDQIACSDAIFQAKGRYSAQPLLHYVYSISVQVLMIVVPRAAVNRHVIFMFVSIVAHQEISVCVLHNVRTSIVNAFKLVLFAEIDPLTDPFLLCGKSRSLDLPNWVVYILVPALGTDVAFATTNKATALVTLVVLCCIVSLT